MPKSLCLPRLLKLPSFLLLAALSAAALADGPAQQSYKVSGLAAPAQILVDRWGVPHMYAASQDDVFFVQGFNAARDRLFQLDLWRRRGLGRLSSVFGADFLEQDKAARLFLYRGDMQKEWQAYGKDAERIAARFVAGVNAYIDLVGANPALLPFEFKQFKYAPEKWQAEDVVRIRSHGLVRNLTAEVARAQTACLAGLEADKIRFGLTPPWETKVPAGLDPCLPADVLRTYTAATAVVALVQAPPGAAAIDGEDTGLRMAALQSRENDMEGSNAWVVGPSRTATGRPVLANDPHRAYSTPSLRYIAHLSAPGLDVIGAGEPVLPGISIGHNGTIAFGLTIFSADQEDLVTYELNPANPRQYRYKGKWEDMTVVREAVPIKGGTANEAELLFTRHGPVIYVEKDKNRAFAVRTTWSQPGMAPYFGSIDYMKAKNFTEFRGAMQRWSAPVENQVYADAAGNIGWAPGGSVPQRPNWDGLLPIPGDGRYEWGERVPGTQWPSSFNPKSGFFATANELNMPAGYPYKERKLGFEWPSFDRYNRIVEVLASQPKHTVEDSMRLQNDTRSIAVRRILAVLRTLKPTDARNQAAMQMLANWNQSEDVDSPEAALYEIWYSRYLPLFFKENVLDKKGAAAVPAPDGKVMVNALEKPEAVFGDKAVLKRDFVMLASLSYAWADATKLLGADPKLWQWGKLHHSHMLHPFSAAVSEPLRSKLNVGPFPKQGGGATPNVSGYDPLTFRETAGPSVRLVIDVGQWDNSRAVNTPGQSGDPDSPHYRDLAPMWLKGDYFPLLYSKAAVEAATQLRIELQPAGK